MSNIDVSYIIPCYNSDKTILQCVKTIVEQRGDFTREIILVDSSSSPNLENTLGDYFRHVRLIHSKTRLYPGEARNLGLLNAHGTYLALIDSDVLLNPDWTNVMLEKHRELAVQYDPHIVIGGSIENDPATRDVWSDTLTLIEFNGVLPTSREGFRNGFPSTNLFLPADTAVSFHLSYPSHRMAEDVLFYKEALRKGVRFYFLGRNKVQHMICKRFFRYTFYLGAATCIVRFATSDKLMKTIFALLIPIGSLFKLFTIVLGTMRNDPKHLGYLVRYLPTLSLGLITLHLGMLSYPLTRKKWLKTHR